MIEFKYRPDVDGLRAVAVVLVLLFHAGLGFSGGFVGVDVFFVISGFLITGLILKEQAEDRFSLGNFWMRRVRRILPVSLVVVVATLIAGCFILLPNDLADLGKSTIAQQLMLANVYFWRNTGYFDGPADLKPLLHTWSLAVEEQFYLLYPFLLLLLARFRRGTTVGILGGLFILSLAASQWGVTHVPSSAFFLLPYRAWELLLGGLLVFAPRWKQAKPLVAEVLSGMGLAGIVASGWYYQPEMAFPGLSALVPCGATALFIYANSLRPTTAGRMLSLRPVVAVGLISYSLYLWHWPLLVYYRYQHAGALPLVAKLGVLALSVAAAFLSWKYLETPLRRGVVFKRRGPMLATVGGLSCLLLATGFALWRLEGLPGRFDATTQQLFLTMGEKEFRHVVSLEDIAGDHLPEFGAAQGEVSVLMWGDSHAMALMPALDEACRERGWRGVQATYEGTLPLLGFPQQREWGEGEEFAQAVLAYVQRHRVPLVVVAGYWSRDASSVQFNECLELTVKALAETGTQIVLVRDVPDQGADAQRIVADALRNGQEMEELGVPLEQHRRQQSAADRALLALERLGIIVLDPTPYLVDDAQRCRLVVNGDCLYWDNDHLSLSGARRLTPMFAEVLESREVSSESGTP